MTEHDLPTRRHLLGLCAGFIASAIGVKTAGAQPVPALSKSAVGYRDVPYQGQVCAACVYFVFKPSSGAMPQSRCQLVAGLINPAGWCEVWAPKT